VEIRSENKRQHYVPRLLLRRFAAAHKPTVRLLVIATCRAVDAAPLKQQCYEDNFYGEDPAIDTVLQEVEGKMGTLLQKIDSVERPFAVDSEERAVLNLFLLTQISRTRGAADRANAFLDQISKVTILETFVRNGQLPADALETMKLNYREPAVWSVVNAVLQIPFVLDMGVRVLKAIGTSRFIIGDDPAVLVNQAYGNAPEWNGPTTGIAMRGLQAICPISPKHALFLFDQHLYKVGDKPDDLQVRAAEADVEICNGLQVANARKVLYGGPETSTAQLAQLLTAFGKYRPTDRTRVLKHVFTTPDGKKAKMLISENLELRNPLNWSFCRVKRRYRGSELPAYEPRDSKLCAYHDQMHRDRTPSSEEESELLLFAMRRAKGLA
jgi:hypothetical protein